MTKPKVAKPHPEAPGRGKIITREQWTQFLEFREKGDTRAAAARKVRISERSAERFEGVHGFERLMNKNAIEARDLWEAKKREEALREVKEREGLSDAALAALDDIEVFARMFFGLILRPWQKEAANRIAELYEDPDEQYVVINVAPGTGKTTFFCRIVPAWLTARNRSIRGLIGSNTQRLAEWNLRQLKREFERTVPIRGEPKEVANGFALDALAVMPHEYGNFKPENPELWRGDSFIVAQKGDIVLADKEPTWTAFGRDTGFLGGRFDFIIWDDVYDSSKMRTAEARELLRKWWDEIAETRLEPGGLLVLQGQRLSSDDIYRHALNKVAYIGEDEESMVVSGKKYKHVIFKAHDEDKCTGKHSLKDKAWPDGCCIDPRRLPYHKLRTLKENDPNRYSTIYQQEDNDPDSVLVNPLWVSGGTDADGMVYPGCWDNDRDLWELPKGIPNGIMIATADPSPSKFWSIQCWYYVPETGYRYLLECYRQVMDAPSFLDWNEADRKFVGVCEDWWNITKEIGHPITHWIVEANAAQRFILQYDHFRRWASSRGVTLMSHYTHARNKTDPNYGVWMLAQEYRYGRVRLPGKQKTYARPHSLLLIDEVTHWTPDREHLQTDDCVMAQWFLEHNLKNIRPPDVEPVKLWRPSWLGVRR